MSDQDVYVAVVGPGDAGASDQDRELATEVGRLLAERGAVVVTGGLGGVMEAASRGASGAGGRVLGLLPGMSREEQNAYLTLSVPTGLGQLRNGLVVRSADAVIAIGGGWGTLSEIALAMRSGRAVVGLRSWHATPPQPSALDALREVSSAVDAVNAALAAATRRSEQRPSCRSEPGQQG